MVYCVSGWYFFCISAKTYEFMSPGYAPFLGMMIPPLNSSGYLFPMMLEIIFWPL